MPQAQLKAPKLSAKKRSPAQSRALGIGLALLCFVALLFVGTLAKLWS